MSGTSTLDRPRFFFIDEVAAILRRSEGATRHLITSKQLKAGKVGGRVVVRPEDLDAFIQSGFEDPQ